MNKSVPLDKVYKYLVYLGVILTPLFFLPLAQNVLDFPKRILALVVITLGLIAWLIKQKIRGELRLRKVGKLHWAIGALLGVFALSTVFSIWKGLSFWGTPYSPADSLIGFLILAGLSFLIIHGFKKKEYLNLIQLLIGVTGLVSLFSVLQLYGGSLGIGASTPVGSFNAAAIFAAVVLPMTIALLFHTKRRKIWLGVSALAMLMAITVINFKAAWLVLMLGVLVSLFFSTWNSEQLKIGWVASLMGCLALGLFFYLFRFSLPGFPLRPAEISLGLSSEYDVVRGVFSQGIKSKILGEGPGTFVFNYAQHHSPILNQTRFWGTRFRQGSSVFWDWVITKGVLGALSLVALWGFGLWKGFRGVIQTDEAQWGIKLGVFSSLVALVGASFIFSFNFSLWFLFWVTLGLLGGLFYSDIVQVDLSSKKINIGYSLLLVLIITLGVGLTFVQGIRYYAAAQYKQGIELSRKGKMDQAIEQVSAAAQLNESPFNSPVDLYYRNLSQLYLRRATQVNAKQRRINPGLVRNSIAEGSRAIDKATKIAPFNPANWNVKGFFYRNLIGIERAGASSLKAYRKAAELEPASPFAYTEIGRVNVLMAQQGAKDKKKAFQDASKALDEALKLKPDYAPAHYLRAVVYDQRGNLDKAINNLQKAEQTGGRNLGLTFQLGLLYWRNGDNEQAETQFSQAVKASPNYSNARYMLGVIYDEQGKKEQAKQQFEKVAELNPDNKRVKQILNNLEQGKPALEEVGTTTAPVEETPQEIKK